MSRILIVDEQPVARHALRMLVEAEDHQVVGEAGNGLDALQLARSQPADLMILELAIPRLGGLEVIQRLASQPAGPKILVLTGQDSEYFALRCLEAGAAGFVSKQENLQPMLYPTALLLTAILIVVGLGTYQRLSADVEQKVEAKDKAKRN